MVAINPDDFTKPSIEALKDNVNQKYANKVDESSSQWSQQPADQLFATQIMQNTGLCICFYDLLKASDGMIGHGRGAVHVKGMCCSRSPASMAGA